MSRTLSMSRYSLMIGAAFLMLAATARAQGTFEITAVARLGDPVAAPATLVRASEPRLNNAGEILFRGDGGLLLTSPNGHRVVAAPGDVLPDGRVIATIGDASVNASGQVAFVAALEPSGLVLLLASEGTISEIAQGAETAIFGEPSLRSPSVNTAGDVAFGNGEQILLYSNGATTELVRIDHQALFQGGFGFRFSFVRLNDAGQVAFSTIAESDPGPIAIGVYLLTDGNVRALAHPGIAAPDGGTFLSASSPSLNESGQVAFFGDATAPSPSLQPGMFLFSNNTLTQIAREGDVVDGHPLGLAGPLTTRAQPTIDAQGQVVFPATSQGLSRLFLFNSGVLRRLVGDGDPTSEGDTIASAASPSFSASGELAFVDPVTTLGRVYRRALDGTISRAAGEGDAVPVTPRIVSASTSAVRHNGRPVFLASIFPGERGIFDVNGNLIARVWDVASGAGVVAGITEIASSDNGWVAFTGPAPAANPASRRLFLAREGGTLFEVVRSGAPAPGGGTFFGFFEPSVNASGHISFRSAVSAAPSGIFLAAEGTIAPVVRQGDPAPGGTFGVPLFPSINDAGQIAFTAILFPPFPPTTSIWLISGGELSEVVGSTGEPQLNSAGQVAFQTSMLQRARSLSIFLFTGNEGIRSVARQGDLAPGGGTFDIFNLPSLNSAGHIAFSSSISEGTAQPRSGVFLFADGSLEVIARSGDSAPGGDLFTSVEDPKIGPDGAILFTGTTDSTGTGVFLARRSAAERQISIDIRPAGSANRIDPASTERLPVAILSDAQFDAQTVIVDTVRFGPTGTEATPIRGVPRDVDGDGDIDLVLRFHIQDTGIQCGQTSARLTGQTVDNIAVFGSDAIRTVRCQ